MDDTNRTYPHNNPQPADNDQVLVPATDANTNAENIEAAGVTNETMVVNAADLRDADTATDYGYVAPQVGLAPPPTQLQYRLQQQTTTVTTKVTPHTMLDKLIVAGWLNAEALIYIGLVLMAIVLRVVDLGPRAMHHDESIHARYSYDLFNGAPCNGGTPCAYDPTFHGPFLYYAVATSYFLFGGATETTARLAPAVFGIAIVAICWFLRPLIGRVGALSAAAMMVFSTTLLYWSRSLRHDIFATFGEFLFIIGVFRFMQSRKNGWLFAGGLGLAVAWASHELTFLTLFIVLSYIGIAFFLEVATGPRFGVLRQRMLRPISGGSQDAADSSDDNQETEHPPTKQQWTAPPTEQATESGSAADGSTPVEATRFPTAHAPVADDDDRPQRGIVGRFATALVLAPALVAILMSLLGTLTASGVLDLTKQPPATITAPVAAANLSAQVAAVWPASFAAVILNVLLLAAWGALVLVPWANRAESVRWAARNGRRDSLLYLYNTTDTFVRPIGFDRFADFLADRRITMALVAIPMQLAAFVGQAQLFGESAAYIAINGDPAVLSNGAANTIHLAIWPLTLGLRVLFAGLIGMGIGVFTADSIAGLGRMGRRIAGILFSICVVLGVIVGIFLQLRGGHKIEATLTPGFGVNPLSITPDGWPVLLAAAFPLAASPGVKLGMTDFVMAIFAPHGTPPVALVPMLAIVFGILAAVVVAWLFERDMIVYTGKGVVAAICSTFLLMSTVALVATRFYGESPRPLYPFPLIGVQAEKWIVYILVGVLLTPLFSFGVVGWLVSIADRYTDDEVAGNGIMRGVLRLCRTPGAVFAFLLGWGIIYVLFFSNFFGNIPGLADGFYKGLELWFGKNNDIRRIDEPWFYYSWIMTLDETFPTFVAAIALFAIPITFVRRAWRNGFTLYTVRDHFLSFTIYYTFWAMFLYSIAGEKVPWLNLQIALPTVLMAAIYLDDFLPKLWNGIREWRAGAAIVAGASVLGLILFAALFGGLLDDKGAHVRDWQLITIALLLLLFAGGIWVANWYLRPPAQHDGRPMMSVAIIPAVLVAGWFSLAQATAITGNDVLAILTTIIVGVLLLACAGVVVWLATTRMGWGMAGRIFVAVLMLGAALYNLQESIGLNFNRPDTASDMQIYVQTTPEIPLFMQRMTRMSRDTRGSYQGTQQTAADNPQSNPVTRDPSNSLTMPVYIDQEVAWPLNWYFRDWSNVRYSNSGDQWPLAADKDAHGNQWAVIALKADVGERADVQAALDGRYSAERIKFRWWFPEDSTGYGGLVTNPDMLYRTFTDKTYRDRFFRYIIYRQLWQPLQSYDMVIYVRNDLLPQWRAAGGSAGADDGMTYGLLDGAAKGRHNGQFNQVRSLAIAPNGDFYTIDTANLRVQHFDSTGKYLSQFGTIGTGDGQFASTENAGIGPVGIAVDKQSNVYVTDTWNHRVQKFDANGKFLTKWGYACDIGTSPCTNAGFYGPRGIALDSKGNVYVTDTGNKRVQVFDPNGTFLRAFGHLGNGQPDTKGDPAFDEPIGIAVDQRTDTVYVADTHNKRVQKFDANGTYQGEFPVAGWQVQPGDEPYIAVDGEGNLFISDPPNKVVRKYTPAGIVLATYSAGAGKTSGDLMNPIGIAVAQDGTVYVADSARSAIVTIIATAAATQPSQSQTTPTDGNQSTPAEQTTPQNTVTDQGNTQPTTVGDYAPTTQTSGNGGVIGLPTVTPTTTR